MERLSETKASEVSMADQMGLPVTEWYEKATLYAASVTVGSGSRARKAWITEWEMNIISAMKMSGRKKK